MNLGHICWAPGCDRESGFLPPLSPHREAPLEGGQNPLKGENPVLERLQFFQVRGYGVSFHHGLRDCVCPCGKILAPAPVDGDGRVSLAGSYMDMDKTVAQNMAWREPRARFFLPFYRGRIPTWENSSCLLWSSIFHELHGDMDDRSHGDWRPFVVSYCLPRPSGRPWLLCHTILRLQGETLSHLVREQKRAHPAG